MPSITKNVTPLNTNKKLEDMCTDILRLCREHDYLNSACGDAFLCIKFKDGSMTYIGQTLKPISFLEVLGSLEVMKNMMIKDMVSIEPGNE